MKRAIILISILMLCTSLATAATFNVGEQEETISISPNQEVGKTIIIIDDNEQIASFDSLQANELQLIPVSSGTHKVEIRFVKQVSYEWERPDITKNDEPTLAYVKYDKDDKKVKFSVTGDNLLHPQDVTYGSSNRELLETYTITLNNYTTLNNCYPRITTGDNLFFSCKASEYANKLNITFAIGMIETTKVHIPEITTSIADNNESEKETMPEEEISNEELILKEPIELQDIIKTKSGHMPVTVFIILLFITVMTLLFIASHHSYESKKSGTHHKVKRK